MNFLNSIEKKLNSFHIKLSGSRKGTLLAALITYTALFMTIAGFFIIPAINEKGHILGGDGLAQYHPLLLDFRRNMISFFESLKNGKPSFRMLNPDFMFGFDSFASSFMYFFPFLPVYIFAVFVSEESTMVFFAYAVLIISYLCGINFIAMCRHFGVKNIFSGIFAVSYIFCGNYFGTGMWNPQFMCMYFIFPLLIIGLDNILNDKNGILFSLSVAFLAPGITYLVYTIPFVFVFAVSRVFFSRKKTFIKDLLKYFIRCMIYGSIGIGIAAFNVLPSIYFLTNSARGISELPDISELLIPSLQNLSSTFFYNGIDGDTQLTSVTMPLVIFMLISSGTKKEHKTNLLIMLALIAVPGVWYGTNLFQYTLCRWGFIPACLFSYYSAYYSDKLSEITRSDLILCSFSSLMFLLLCTLEFSSAATVFILIVSISAAILSIRKKQTTLSEMFTVLLSKIKKYYIDGKDSPSAAKRISILAVIAVMFITALLGTVTVIQTMHYALVFPYIISLLLTVSVIIIFRVKFSGYQRTFSLITVIIFTVSSIIFYNYRKINDSVEFFIDPGLEALHSYQDPADGITRFADINTECSKILYENYFTVSDQNGSTTSLGNKSNGSGDIQRAEQIRSVNNSLRYNIANTEAFYSVTDSDYIRFLIRCGADKNVFPNKVRTAGFYGWESLYSLFGVKYLYSYKHPENNLYGCSDYDSSNDLFISKNNYSIPLGSVYDTLTDKETFSNFSAPELPVAMMDSVYLEGYDTDRTETLRSYSRTISYEAEKKPRGTNAYGIESNDTKIRLNDDTSDGFLFLVFDDVAYKTIDSFKIITIKVGIGTEQTRSFEIENQLNDWEWYFDVSKYTFPLGYHERSVNELNLIIPFEYGNMSVVYIPAETYTAAAEDRNKEKLENISVTDNTVTGDIDLSSDKILVMSFIHNEGWKAFIDEAETEIYKANELFLGIKVPEGKHRIRFEYKTPYLSYGLIISVISFTVLMALTFLLNRKKRI